MLNFAARARACSTSTSAFSISSLRGSAIALGALALACVTATAACSPGNTVITGGDPDATPVDLDGGTIETDSGPPPVGSCKLPPGAGFLKDQSLTVGGVKRLYSISLPPSYDSKKLYPVIFAFHGDGGTGESMKNGFNFEAKHGDEAIFVYPNGTGNTWDNDTFDSTKNKDVLFIDAIVAELKANYCVQPTKFYATGFSRGGFFTSHIACQRGDVFAAVSPQGGGGPYDGSGKNFDNNGNLLCPSKRKIPVLFVIGQNDSLLKDARDGRKHWLWSNSCQAATTAAAPAPCVTYNGCGKEIKWCEIPGQGHDVWSQGTETAWQFFKKY
jgi:polyhydroxybutyrate depolymerase